MQVLEEYNLSAVDQSFFVVCFFLLFNPICAIFKWKSWNLPSEDFLGHSSIHFSIMLLLHKFFNFLMIIKPQMHN